MPMSSSPISRWGRPNAPLDQRLADVCTPGGSQGAEFAPTYCEATLADAVSNLANAIEENGATVTHDPLPTVMADRNQLTSLFQNLLSNAIKFRAVGPPIVHVSARRNENEWLFSVRDNGIGIDPEHFERIFLIFQRLHGRSEYSGTGSVWLFAGRL